MEIIWTIKWDLLDIKEYNWLVTLTFQEWVMKGIDKVDFIYTGKFWDIPFPYPICSYYVWIYSKKTGEFRATDWSYEAKKEDLVKDNIEDWEYAHIFLMHREVFIDYDMGSFQAKRRYHSQIPFYVIDKKIKWIGKR